MAGTAIGIDLGTTNSCAGVFRNGKVEIIANMHGNRIMPSVVSFTKEERYIGEGAKLLMVQNPENTIYGVKRLIGRKYKDKSLQADMEMLPFRVVSDFFKPKIVVSYRKKEKKFTPQEISAMILKNLKETAEIFLEHDVTEAVITVPAHFDDSQRKATIDAGKIAGLKVLQVLNEPTAAAIAYGMDKRIADERNILIYDFGGGTFDVSIMTIKNGVFQVRATNGNNHLGGGDIDNKLVVHMMNDIKNKYQTDISLNKKALSRLRIGCETAKITLSSQETARIDLDNLIDGLNYSTSMTRSRFEHINEDLFRSTIILVQDALSKANMDKKTIHNVVLVGGSTRIPKVQSLLQEFFEGKPLNKGINQDEAVAYGAAVQAAILKGIDCDAISNLRIIDVTPFSLGIEVDGGNTCVLIYRNTPLPTTQKRTFRTDAGQDEFKINIYQGEQKMVKDNNCLGNFVLKGFPPSAKGVDVDVTFEVDENGSLTVSAIAGNVGVQSKLTITNDQGRLTNDEITRMAQKQNKYKANDEKQRKCIEIKSSIHDYIYKVESKIAADAKNKIGKSEKQKILGICKNISEWIDEDTLREIQECQDKQKKLEKIGKPILKKLK